MQHYVLTTSGDIVVCFHTAVFEFVICQLRSGVFNLLLGKLYTRENEVIPEVRKRFDVFVWRRFNVILNPHCDVTGNTRMVAYK